MYISPEGELGDFLNHSCRPNTYIKKINSVLYVVALNNIFSGDEVFFDYSTIIADDDIWEMQCNCDESTCRGIVSQFSRLPKKLRESYITHDMVPEYIFKA